MTTTHRHRVHTSEDYGFMGPVSRRENPAAHGNITQWDTCRCGAQRATNINGRHIERGEWEHEREQVAIDRNAELAALLAR